MMDMSTTTCVNKVIYGQTTLIDLTDDTVTEETLFKDCTAHKADGTIIKGTMLRGYPDVYSFFETMQDSSGEDILDSLGLRVQGRIVYRKL